MIPPDLQHHPAGRCRSTAPSDARRERRADSGPTVLGVGGGLGADRPSSGALSRRRSPGPAACLELTAREEPGRDATARAVDDLAARAT